MLNLVVHIVTTGLLEGNFRNRTFLISSASCVQISSVQRAWRQSWRSPSERPASQHGVALRVSVSCSGLSSWISFHLLRSRGLWTGSMNCRVLARRRLSVLGRPSTQVRNKLSGSYFHVERDHCLFSRNTPTVSAGTFFHYFCLIMTFSCILWSEGASNVNKQNVVLKFAS